MLENLPLSHPGASRPARLSASLAVGVWMGMALTVHAQTLSRETRDQLDHLIGSRVETFAVLGTQSGAVGGTYVSKINDTNLDVGQIAGRGDVGEPQPILDWGIGWNPVVEGGFGRSTFDNHFHTAPLAGNESIIETWSVFAGGGLRLTTLDFLSLAPTFGLLYSHTSNSFDANNDFGQLVLSEAGGKLVNWRADTLSVVPGIELRIMPVFGPLTVTATSMFKYFNTQPVSRSTDALSFQSDSEWWFNELDLEEKLPLYLWSRQLRLGTDISRSGLYGGLEDSFGVSTIYQAGGRFVMDLEGLLWKIEYAGLGAQYFWGEKFSGVSYGIEVSLKL
jgi:hypothetical protein